MAQVVVKRVVTTPAPSAESSLGAASGWTSEATRSLFSVPGSSGPTGRIRRAAPRAVISTIDSHARTHDADTAGRIRRSTNVARPSASGPDGGVLDDATTSRIRRFSGKGAPIDAHVRPSIESAFGADFGKVRVHAESALPADIGAIAFTHGNDVHFAPGQYQPDTTAGLHTLSHELTHVVQQGSAPPSRLHRLMSATAFEASAKEKVYQVHGKTMSEIDKQLSAYDALKVRAGHLDRSGGIDKAINILTRLQQDIAYWRKSHAQDSKRQKQRLALDALDLEVAAELISINDTRRAYAEIGLVGDIQMEGNKFVEKMEGSASSVFDKISPVIAAAVPSPGDGAQLEISVKIPVDPSTAGYVGFSLGIGIQRLDRSSTKISLKAAVNGGLQVMGTADVGFELGAFIEAQGKDPKAALQLISWGWYRRFRESVLPREVASFMWGGSTGSVGWARSETWAANIEKKNLDYDPNVDQDLSSGVGSGSTTNAYVRTGGYGSAAAKGTLGGIATLEGSATLSGGTHYDKDTINARKGKRGGNIGEAESMPARGKTTYLGTRFMKLEAGLGVSVGPFSGSLGGAVEWLWDQTPDPKKPGKKKGVRLEYLSAAFSAGATVPLGGMLANELADGIIKLAPSAINLIKTLSTKASKEDETGAPEGVGQLVAQGEAVATAFKAFPQEAFSFTDFSISDEPMKPLAEQLKSGADLGESASTISIGIAFGKNLWDRSAPIAVDITLNSEQGIQLDASIVAVKAVRARRILRLKFTGGKWKPEVD